MLMENAYSIKLPLFEGPLDLLLHLIKDQKIDIYDIPIALITRQYLEYIEIMKELNLDIAGEFLVMAATLIHIKSRMLLPVEETADTEELEDPRLELVMKLLEYRVFKDAALSLKEREDEWSSIFTREPLDEEEEVSEDEDQPVLFELNLFDLLTAFQNILEKAPEEIRTLTKETLTIKDKMNIIIEALQSKDALRFDSLFKGDLIRSHFVMTLIALLELIRLGVARVYQEKQFGVIWVISPESERDFSGSYLSSDFDSMYADEEPWQFERQASRPMHDFLPRRNPFPPLFGMASGKSLPARMPSVPSKRKFSSKA
jgi:segregation and condensation protein A